MDYTNEVLEVINSNLDKNKIFGFYYEKLANEYNKKSLYFSKFNKKAKRMYNCMDYWKWQLYEKNKLMDLQKVNRCNNNRFCSNCKKVDIARFIYKFNPIFDNLLQKGYKPFLLTLTVPNCSGSDLNKTIDLLYKNFYRLFRGFSEDSQNAFKFRSMKWLGALKVLEITYNKFNNTYHPHLHCIVFLNEDITQEYYSDTIKGLYSNKSKSFHYYSLACEEVAQCWTMLYKKIRMTEKNFINFTRNPYELFQVDFRLMDYQGIKEVIKYTFKDSDIVNFDVFKAFVYALENRHIRQGYGCLYDLQCENVEEGDLQKLNLDIEEPPVDLLTKGINILLTTYKNYKKVSRFSPNIDYSD